MINITGQNQQNSQLPLLIEKIVNNYVERSNLLGSGCITLQWEINSRKYDTPHQMR